VEDAFAPLLLALDALPVRAHTVGSPRFDVPEHVRVATDELLVHGPRDLREITGAPLLQQQGEEVDLEEKIAELVEQLRVVRRQRSVGDLVRLLDGVRDDRDGGLLPVPGQSRRSRSVSCCSSSRASARPVARTGGGHVSPSSWEPEPWSWSPPVRSRSGVHLAVVVLSHLGEIVRPRNLLLLCWARLSWICAWTCLNVCV
jgi:hypothetical protein